MITEEHEHRNEDRSENSPLRGTGGTELDGTVNQYIPQGMIAVGAPAAGRTVYGAITQVEQTDGEFHTYTGVDVPKYISDAAHNTRELTLSSAPLPMPNNECPFSVAKVIN